MNASLEYSPSKASPLILACSFFLPLSPSMRRPVSVKSVFLFPPYKEFLCSSRAASVAILPSALFVERFSLGASWASSFQQVLLPDNRPWLTSLRRELGQDLVAVTFHEKAGECQVGFSFSSL